MNEVIGVCGRRGAKISDDATKVCPACLLESGLGLLEEESVAGSLSPAATNVVQGKKSTRPAKMPRDFGDYELMEEIRRGSQGVVYRAHQKTSFVFDFFLFFSRWRWHGNVSRAHGGDPAI